MTTAEAILFLKSRLNVDDNKLSSMVGVSPTKVQMAEENQEIVCLHDVVKELELLRPGVTGERLVLILQNGEVPIVSTWEDITSLPLIGYICARDGLIDCKAAATLALSDYEAYEALN